MEVSRALHESFMRAEDFVAFQPEDSFSEESSKRVSRVALEAVGGEMISDQASSSPFTKLPKAVFASLVHYCFEEDQRNLGQALFSRGTKHFLPVLRSVRRQELAELLANEEIRRLFAQVYGFEVMVPEDLRESSDEVITQMLRQIKREMAVEVERLPILVRQTFGLMDIGDGVQEPEPFRSMLQAIRSYNLLCVGERLGGDYLAALESKNDSILIAETVAHYLLTQAETLTELDLHSAGLTSLPLEITKFKKLKSLNLCDNKLDCLPSQIRALTKLKRLDLSKNLFSSLPKGFSDLTNIRFLNLSENHFLSLPALLKHCKLLTELHVHHNQLETIDVPLGHLLQLQNLDLSFNRLTTLPHALGAMTSLRFVNVRGNPWQFYPESIVALQRLARAYRESEVGVELTVETDPI